MPTRRSSRDASQEAVKAVQHVTGTGKVNGEDLLGSPELKRKLREAKARGKKPSVRPAMRCNIRGAFHGRDYSWGTDNKVFGERDYTSDSLRKNGVAPIVSTQRKALIGSPNLGTVTTSHFERVFLSVRQECTRLTRLTLGYSKDLEMHKASVALYFGVYNFVRKHKTLGTTPAVAAGIEESRWTLEQVVEMTDAYWAPKYEAEKAEKAMAKRIQEDRKFARAFKLAGL